MAFVFLLSIKPHKPKSNDRFTSNFDWGTQQKHGNVLGLIGELNRRTGMFLVWF